MQKRQFIGFEQPRRVAIVHDWLTISGGAERVLEQMLHLYPDADLYTVCDFLDESKRGFLAGRRPQTTFIQKMPFAKKHYRSYLGLMPLAIEQLDLSSYDLVLSSSYAVAKGVLTGPDQLHVSYIHTPVRYAWHLQHQYLQEMGLARGIKSWIVRWLLHKVRSWDTRTTAGVDVMIANSAYIARQIYKVYGRESQVVYPPVEVDALPFRASKDDFYLTASRLVPYKRIDLIVQAFAQMPERRLVVIGEGPERAKIEAAAFGHKNIEILGYRPTPELTSAMSRARAFIFAAIEDFGITPVEAQACGTPVIALGIGGACESVRGFSGQARTGLFFQEQTIEALIDAVDRFEAEGSEIRPEDCRANAVRFSAQNFRSNLSRILQKAWEEHQQRRLESLSGGSSLDIAELRDDELSLYTN